MTILSSWPTNADQANTDYLFNSISITNNNIIHIKSLFIIKPLSTLWTGLDNKAHIRVSQLQSP